jgi:sugar lactone lactonase YvrE
VHVFPDLKRLEGKYARELTVVGIHSAKFPGEKSLEGIREAVARYGLRHPVANDADFAIWKRYGIRSWPTIVLVDPEGRAAGYVSGEGHYDVLDRKIGELVAEAERKKTLRRDPLPGLAPPETPADLGRLAYPGKVAAGGDPARVFVADSNHNRVVVAEADGAVVDLLGSGSPGADDGPFEKASFRWPQGLALDGDALWIADTENHLLRRADLKARRVETVAGTGAQEWRGGWFRGAARETPLNSPWDLLVDGDTVYVAMAGDHRLWTLDRASGTVGPFAGSGREDIADGDLRSAAFSQPSGLALSGRTLYVADSEDSAVRAVDLGKGRVSTLVGMGLFEFGDVDGTGDAVRLQHPLAVLWDAARGRLLVADTYNHRLKTLDPARREARSLAGSGKRGSADGAAGAAMFHEPSGLARLRDRILVADTNNHALRLVDPATGAVSTLALRFPAAAPPQHEGKK